CSSLFRAARPCRSSCSTTSVSTSMAPLRPPRWCRSRSRSRRCYCWNASLVCVPMFDFESEETNMTEWKLSRRIFLRSTGAAAAAVAAPAILHAQTPTLKTTAWGGKWGEVMKGQIIPAFEKEFKCKVETDAAFPYYPKLQATPRNAPLYDVLQSNTNEQWQC